MLLVVTINSIIRLLVLLLQSLFFIEQQFVKQFVHLPSFIFIFIYSMLTECTDFSLYLYQLNELDPPASP